MNPTLPLRIHVEPDRLAAQPTEPVSMSLSVFNTSDIIDGFDITVVGADQEWVQTEPDWISLFPDTEGTVGLDLTLPSDFPAGPHDLGVKVTSRTTNELFAVGGVTLDVAERRMARLDVEPDSVVAGRKGRFSVVLFNDGNVPIDVAIDVEDDANALGHEVVPPRIQLGPGQSRTCQLVVTAPRPITGSPVVRPLVVTAEGSGVEIAAPATLTSKPWIPRWLLTFLAIAALLALWAFIVGLALDAVVDDMDQDVADAFEDGMAAVVDAVAPDAGAEPGDVVSGPAGTVPGTVTTASEGAPVAGATVSAVALISAGSEQGEVDPDRDPVEVATEDDGTFVFEEMVRGSYQVGVSAAGYTPSEPVAVDVPYEGDPLAVELVGAPGLVSGVVLAGGEPLAEATILVRRLDPATGNAIGPDGQVTEEPWSTAATPESGRFAVDELATPASYELDVSRPGYTPMRVIVDLEPGQRLVGLEVELLPAGAGTLTGSVVDAATGDPLGGVTVVVDGEGTQLSTTTLTSPGDAGSTGSYRLGGLPIGEYTATFSLDGYDDVALPLSVTDESPEVALSPAMNPTSGAPIGVLEGTVTTADSGARLGGVTVSVSGDGGELTTSSLTEERDGLGVGDFRLTGVPTGSYTATFTSDGYQSTALPLTLTAEDSETRLDAVMSLADDAPIGSISGQVTDTTTGAGLGGITVTVTGEGVDMSTVTLTEPSGTATTAQGEEGHFVLNAIPTGSFTATFSSATHQTVAIPFTVTVDEPASDLSPVMEAFPTRVTGSTSEIMFSEGPFSVPIEGVDVIFAGDVVGTSGSDGEFTATVNAPPGDRTLAFRRTGFRTTRRTVSIVPGEPVDMGTVPMYRLGDVSGSFFDEFGRNVAGPGRVTFRVVDVDELGGLPDIDPDDIDPQSAPMAEGFTVEDLPGPAVYEIRASFSNGNPGGRFRQVYRSTTTFEAMVNAGSGSAGQVTIPYAPRVIHAEVSCFGSPYTGNVGLSSNPNGGTPIRSASPDAQGRVVFPPVPNGGYLLGYRIINEGGDPEVVPTSPAHLVQVPGTPLPVDANAFCGGD